MVLDASAVLEILLRTTTGVAIEGQVLNPAETLHAPHLLDLEIAQVLRRLVVRGTIAESRAEDALADFDGLSLTRYPHNAFLPRIWAMRGNLTAYDAAYVALAEALDAPLLTCDRALAAAPGHGARIELVA